MQVRLTHSLGERLIELSPCGPDEPAVVGRAQGATVQVPSAAVAKSQCLFFVAEGRWVIQDAGSQGTFLNGEPVTDPAFVNTGDVITLGGGANPPTITIDPHGLGVIIEDEQPAAAPAILPQQHYAPSQLPQPPAMSTGASYALPPQPQARRQSYGDVADDDNIFAAAPTPAYAAQPNPYQAGYAPPEVDEFANIPQETRYYVPKPKKNQGMIVGVTVGAIVIALGLGAWILIEGKRRQDEAAKPKIITIQPDPPKVTPKKPAHMFDFGDGTHGGGSETPRPPASRTSVAPTPTPTARTNEEPEAPTDPAKQTDEWLAIERERNGDPVRLIVLVNSYKEINAASPHLADLDKYVDQAVDLIWFKRIAELCDERDAAQAEIERIKRDIHLSQDPEFKKGLQADLSRVEDKRRSADERLKDQMKYTAAAKPDLYNTAQLSQLKTQRDEKFFTEWKAEVLAAIKRSRGDRLPWRATR